MLRADALVTVMACSAAILSPRHLHAAGAQQPLSGIVHEARPTENQPIAGARIEAVVAGSHAVVATSGADGRFAAPAGLRGTVLEVSKTGFQPTRVAVGDATSSRELDIAMLPEHQQVRLNRSGSNDCVDLARPPEGVPGVREYARFPAHHDGALVVTAAKLPFADNPGYLYQLTPEGWLKNEVDYILLREPLPVRGGFWYVVTFGGGADLCGSWSVDATHPN